MSHYSYKCDKCGCETPEFDDEKYLKEYVFDWKITEKEIICSKCLYAAYLTKKRMIENVILTVIMLLILYLIFK